MLQNRSFYHTPVGKLMIRFASVNTGKRPYYFFPYNYVTKLDYAHFDTKNRFVLILDHLFR
jgi:hypothetical protein